MVVTGGGPWRGLVTVIPRARSSTTARGSCNPISQCLYTRGTPIESAVESGMVWWAAVAGGRQRQTAMKQELGRRVRAMTRRVNAGRRWRSFTQGRRRRRRPRGWRALAAGSFCIASKSMVGFCWQQNEPRCLSACRGPHTPGGGGNRSCRRHKTMRELHSTSPSPRLDCQNATMPSRKALGQEDRQEGEGQKERRGGKVQKG